MVALMAIGVLVVLVARLKINAFIALLVASVLAGLGAVSLGSAGENATGASVSYTLLGVARSMQEGLGATLGGIGAVMALGAMLGRLLAESGGAEVLAGRLERWFGLERAPWCVLVLALVVGLATWFTVGLLLLLPIVLRLARDARGSFVGIILPFLAALSVMHGLMPPHPGPAVAVDALGADSGWVLFWGALVGLPVIWLAGPCYGRWLAPRLELVPPRPAETPVAAAPARPAPGFGLTLVSILMPVGLMLAATLAELALPPNNALLGLAKFMGDPRIALLIAVVFGLWSLGTRGGRSPAQILKATEQSVAEIGMTILIVGAGGGFARVLRDGGVAEAIGALAGHWHLPPLVYGWLLAAFIRAATGSATVGITTAAGLLAPVLGQHPDYTPAQVALVVVAMGSGSLFLSHLNDGGFWLVKDTLGLNLRQTILTWGVCETIVGMAGLLLSLAYFALL